MSGSRKDSKGRVLRKGEYQRSYDNKYVYGYTDTFGNRKYIYSKDLIKLRKREEALIRDQMDGIDVYVAGSADVNYLFERYISTKTNLNVNTLSMYRYNYDRYVRDGFGKKIINKVRYSDILSFYKYLHVDRNLSVNTIDKVHSVLYASFKLAVRDNIIRNNPCEGALGELKRSSKKNTGVRKALTIEEQRAFLQYVNNSPVYYKWKPLFVFMFGTGCRISEVIGIRWSDIDMHERVIDINHNLTYRPNYFNNNKSEFKLGIPKTESGIRKIPMIEEVHKALLDLYKYYMANGFPDDEVCGISGFVFGNKYGKVHKPETINEVIERIRVAYNSEEVVEAAREHREPILIPHFSNHIIRHTFCTRLCETESNIKTIQYIMGHADIQTTMNIYAEATKEKNREAMDNFSQKVSFF